MDKSFKKALEKAANLVKQKSKEVFRVVSHIDCDGICSSAIMISALKREGISFSISNIKQLTQENLNELSREEYNNIIFTDLGSGQIENISKTLKDKTIIILDHHQFETKLAIPDNILHINPLMFNYDFNDSSGSSVAYLFARQLNEKNKNLAHIAIIGSIGDVQENKGFTGINNEILHEAIENNLIELKVGLRMFGIQTKPIHKVLQYSLDPYIPGITGNELACLELLEKLQIPAKEDGEWRKIANLTEDETKKLVTEIILRRLGSEITPDDVLGNIYLLKDEENESLTKDAKEFSTLLNACGRLNKASLGIGTLLKNQDLRTKAINLVNDYKKEIINALNWFNKNRKSNSVIEDKGYVIINTEDNIRETIVGTLASMLSKSNLYAEGTIILALAHTLEGETKASLRISGFRKSEVNLKEIMSKITEKIGCSAGGHKFAAGCIIPQEKEAQFIGHAKSMLTLNETFIKGA